MEPGAVEHLRERDARLRPWIDRIGPIALPARRSRDPYRALLESIVYQQLHGTAAQTIWKRVLALFGNRTPTPEQLLATDDQRLRAAGLSGGKTRSMKAVAAGALAGEVPGARAMARMPETAIHECLTRIHGIGPWTVDMLLIFTLARPDVMPLGDYGIRKGFMIAHRKRKMPTPGQLLEGSAPWSPYRTTAALYLWKIADAAK